MYVGEPRHRRFCVSVVLEVGMITGFLTGHTCGDACWHARDLVCHCSCGGRNHGIFSRGGSQPIRTAKIGGDMYQLVEVGPCREIEARRMQEIKACGHHWYFDPAGPWIKKPASKTAIKNWPEVQGFGSDCYILWKKLNTEVLQ